MKKSFIVVRYERIHNQDFTTLCKEILTTLQHADLDALQLKNIYSNAEKRMTPLLKQIDFTARKLPQTTELNALRKRLEEVVSALLLYLKAMKRAAFDDQKAAIKYAYSYVRNLLKEYPHQSIPARNSFILVLLSQLNKDQEMNDALEKLGAIRFVEEIKRLQQLKLDKEDEKLESGRKLPKPGSAIAAKTQMIAELKFLLMSIEMKKQEYPDLDYSKLLININIHLTEARARFRNLETRRKTRKRKNENLIKDGDTKIEENDAEEND